MKKTRKAFISVFAIFFSAILTAVMSGLFVILLKQIELLSINQSSYQAYYVADGAWECAVYKERIATGTSSYFLPANYSSIGNCGVSSDLGWDTTPSAGYPSNSVALYSMTNSKGESYCARIAVTKQDLNTSAFHTMSIRGQAKACADTATRVIERLIEFSY